jgi:F-type H+-transporting ATPase subunit b
MRIYLPGCVLFCALLIGSATRPMAAQESSANAEHPGSQYKGEENTKPDFKWHLVNTALFALGLGYFIWKSAPGFFNARSADIQRAIEEATGLKMQADLRYSEIDRKMATLPDEVKKMRDEARAALDREHERLRRETAHDLEHVRSSVAAEVEALQQEGIKSVRSYTLKSALELAEHRLRERAVGTAPEQTVQDFVSLVERSKH